MTSHKQNHSQQILSVRPAGVAIFWRLQEGRPLCSSLPLRGKGIPTPLNLGQPLTPPLVPIKGHITNQVMQVSHLPSYTAWIYPNAPKPPLEWSPSHWPTRIHQLDLAVQLSSRRSLRHAQVWPPFCPCGGKPQLILIF